MAYRLTLAATEDLIHIYGEGVRFFGATQAEKYQDALEYRVELLEANPRMGRERLELTPPMRINPCGSHIIVYLIDENDDVLTVRLRHHREDWINDPAGED